MTKIVKTRLSVLFVLFSYLSLGSGYAQDSSRAVTNTIVSVYSYIDLFYTYDFNEPEGNQRLPYIFNFNRHNEFNMNLGAIGISLRDERFRSNLALQAGTYPADNYANEEDIFKLINDANIGLSFGKKRKFWIDMGIFGSHIGFESPFQVDDLTLTRSLMAESAPYFLAGLKLSYNFNEKWKLQFILTNGWQRIKRVSGNSLLSIGTSLSYKVSDEIELHWNTFVGTDDPDSTRRMRYFNEIHGVFYLGSKWTLKAGVDYGIQQASKGSTNYHDWLTSSIITRYSFHKNWSFSARGEYVIDLENVVIANPSPNEFSCWGLSGNIDYRPNKNLIARLEGRYLFSENDIFVYKDGYTSNNFFVTVSISMRVGKDFSLNL